MTGGDSRELPKGSSTLLDNKLLMSELRASADEAAWALPPSSVPQSRISLLLRLLIRMESSTTLYFFQIMTVLPIILWISSSNALFISAME